QLNEFSTSSQSIKKFEQLIGKPWADCSKEEIAKYRAEVQKRVYEGAEGLVFVKTHNALMSDRGHPTINLSVTTGAVYIVRNPLDVVLSYAPHMGLDIDRAIERMATPGVETGVTEKMVYEVWGSWSEHVESWTRNERSAI